MNVLIKDKNKTKTLHSNKQTIQQDIKKIKTSKTYFTGLCLTDQPFYFWEYYKQLAQSRKCFILVN